MSNHLLNRLRRNKSHKERGMAGLLYVFFFVLIVGILGVAFDGALGGYTANSIRDIANSATVNAASTHTVYKGNNRAIDKAAAKKRFNTDYSAMRKAYPNVTKMGNYKLLKFAVTKTRGGKSANTLTVQIQEKSKTYFVSVLGIKDRTYKPISTARLGALYENR